MKKNKTLIKYSNYMDDVSENMGEQNSNKKHKILILFHHMIADMLSNKKTLQPLMTALFIIGRKRNISPHFISQYLFAATKNFRLNCTHFFVMNI